MTVYEILYPSDCKYTGHVHLAVITRTKEFKIMGSCTFAQLGDKIKKLNMSRKIFVIDCLLTKNSN